MVLISPWIVIPAIVAPATVQELAGQYRLSQMEMAGALELRADGRFRYSLDYGAISEAAEGRWSMSANAVKLTSEPMNPDTLYDMERNDADLQGEVLAIDGDTLVMDRYDARMFFRRVRR